MKRSYSYDTDETVGVVAVMSVLVVVIGSIFGWVMNIVQLVNMMTGTLGVLFVFKALGVVIFPLGAVLGWIGLF